MPKGRPRSLTAYERMKAKKIRETLSEKGITRFDRMNKALLLDTVRISDGRIFVSTDYCDQRLEKIARFIDAIKGSEESTEPE